MRTKWILRRGASAILSTLALLSLSANMADSRDPAYRAEITVDGNSIVVVDPRSGAVLHSIPKPPGVIRQVFALENGAVVAATRGGSTEFLSARTGTQTARLDEPVHAVSHGGARLLTFSADHRLVLRTYPALGTERVLGERSAWGPSAASFSPDDRYLVVEFCNHYPLSDAVPLNPVFDKTLYTIRLYDLRNGSLIPDVTGARMGTFSEDARHYKGDDGNRFDLTRRVWVQRTEDGR